MKKVTITIASKDYNVTLDDDFAKFFESDLAKFLNENNALGTKDLLTAYVQKCYEQYQQTKSINELSLKVTESIK